MLILNQTALIKRTPARHTALLSAACAAALLIASPVTAQQLTTGGAGTAITNITSNGNGQLTVGGSAATAADGRITVTNSAGATQAIIDGNSGNIVGLGTLSVGAASIAGAATIGSTLAVTGASTLGTTTTGFTTVTSTLDVQGHTNTRGLSNLTGGFINAGGINNVSGDIDNAGALINDGSAIIGNSTGGSTLTVSNGTGAGGATFSVDGATGNTAISGQLRVVDRTVLDGATQVNNTLTVTGTSTLAATTTTGLTNTGLLSTSTATIGGSGTQGSLFVIGSAGNTTMSISGTASDFTNFGNITSLNGDISTGAGNITADNGLVRGATLESLGAATVGTTLAVGTDATIGGTLGVTGAATLGSTLNVVGLTTTAGITNVGAINNTGSLTVNAGGNSLQVNGANGVTASAGAGALDINTTSASVGFGNNGMVADADSLVLTGGTASTTLTLNDGGASFANTSGGAPVTVTGVANGTSQFDAVNYGQLSSLESNMSAGIASIAAIANIPAPPSGKRFALGGAVGGFNGETAFAIGGTANVTSEVVVKASVGFSGGEAAFGAGAAYAW